MWSTYTPGCTVSGGVQPGVTRWMLSPKCSEVQKRVDLRGHYLNRRDQEKRDLVAVFGAVSEALAPLIELAGTL
jgi:hypothetical protein